MKEFNLGWGNAVAVRHAFLDGLALKTVFFSLNDTNLGYTAHDGDPRLIYITRKIIERQVGLTFKHVLLTNGATGGVTIALRAFAQQGHRVALTRNPPFFSIYPSMIEAAGLEHRFFDPSKDDPGALVLLDSPANPTGSSVSGCLTVDVPVIWDAVYHGRAYSANNFPPSCDVMVGSYSKLLGLNGIRTGWIATNDDLLYLRLKKLVEAEYCGLSSASNAVLLNVLKGWYQSKNFWENFELKARANLDNNRTELSILEKYFGDQPVCKVGMFYYAPVDAACKRLLEKANVKYTPGSSLHATDDFGRFNVGQDCRIVREAVKTILRADRR